MAKTLTEALLPPPTPSLRQTSSPVTAELPRDPPLPNSLFFSRLNRMIRDQDITLGGQEREEPEEEGLAQRWEVLGGDVDEGGGRAVARLGHPDRQHICGQVAGVWRGWDRQGHRRHSQTAGTGAFSRTEEGLP